MGFRAPSPAEWQAVVENVRRRCGGWCRFEDISAYCLVAVVMVAKTSRSVRAIQRLRHRARTLSDRTHVERSEATVVRWEMYYHQLYSMMAVKV